MWSISPDKPEKLRDYRDKSGMKIPLLVDADSATIEAYGILNQRHGGVPHPAVVIVDREGKVRFVHVDENYRRRPAPEVLIDALRKVEEQEEPAGIASR